MLLPWLRDPPPWEQGTWNDAPNERQHEEEEETKGAAFWVWVRGVGWLSSLQHGELMGSGCECPGILCRSPSLPIRDFWLISPPCLLRGSMPGGQGEGWGSPGGAGWGLGLCRFSQRSEAAPTSAQMCEHHPAPPGAIGGCSPAAAFGPGCGGAHPPSGQHRGKPGCCIVRGCTDMQRGKNIIIYSIYSARHGQEQSSSSTSGATAKAGQQPGRVPTDGKKSAPWSQKKQQKSSLQNSH